MQTFVFASATLLLQLDPTISKSLAGLPFGQTSWPKLLAHRWTWPGPKLHANSGRCLQTIVFASATPLLQLDPTSPPNLWAGYPLGDTGGTHLPTPATKPQLDNNKTHGNLPCAEFRMTIVLTKKRHSYNGNCVQPPPGQTRTF